MPVESQEIIRPRPVPYYLRKLAAAAGMEPVPFLRALLARHASYVAAAEEIGVSRETIRIWRKRYGIVVKTAPE